MGEKKRRSWWLVRENYQALADECKRRGLSDNAMLNEIIREWREHVHQNDAKSVQLSSPSQ